MSMEKEYMIHDVHSRPVTAIGCNIARREIFLGFEDGIVKSIDAESGKYIQSYNVHKGWITSFMYWHSTKLFFVTSNDCMISVINSGGNLVDKIFMGLPVYTLIYNARRKEAIVGVNGGLQFHDLFETREATAVSSANAHYITVKPKFTLYEHIDIVRCVVCMDARIYSAGFDGRLIIYDCPFAGRESAITYFRNMHAHNAGISCLRVERDNIENTLWVITGSFDKTVKVWTGEGKIVHKLSGFLTAVTGICYVPKNKTICCVAGTNSATIIDPKSGEDVSNFIDTFNDDLHENYYLHLIKYVNEFNIMLATTSRKQLIAYKYNRNACLTSLKCKNSIDSIAFTQKTPILIFTGDATGSVIKYEQMQYNDLMYSSEELLKSQMVPIESSFKQGQATTQNNNKQLNKSSSKATARKTNIVLKLVYVESIDLVLAACEDGNIYVWGFDDEAVKILQDMKYNPEGGGKANVVPLSTNVATDENNFDHLEINNTETAASSEFYNQQQLQFSAIIAAEELAEAQIEQAEKQRRERSENESVTKRVAGFVLKKVLGEHTSCVTCLAVIDQPTIHTSRFLLSSGWDRRICLWDLDNLCLYDIFRNNKSRSFEEVELASDGNILDMAYCEKADTFAYASSDSLCYIRKFAPIGSEMTLVDTLQGHVGDVNCIRWHEQKSQWITGGEDTTIRIWSDKCDCIQVINCGAAVNTICFDLSENTLCAACNDTIKVFEMTDYHLAQTNIGHHDSIRDMCFIPERGHIVSVSWDKSIKIWRAYRKQRKVHQKIEKESEKKFETWVWDSMKTALKREVSFDMSVYAEKLALPVDPVAEQSFSYG